MGFRLATWMETKRLQLLLSNISLSSGPRWSPDGQQALVIGLPDFPNFGYFEFYTISRSGEVARLTDLGAYKAKISINRIRISYSWSPDGRYIAFWITIDEDPVERLAVLDVSTHSVVNYCVPGLKPLGAYPPIWSSDGQQMVVYDPSLEGPVVVVDIKQKESRCHRNVSRARILAKNSARYLGGEKPLDNNDNTIAFSETWIQRFSPIAPFRYGVGMDAGRAGVKGA